MRFVGVILVLLFVSSGVIGYGGHSHKKDPYALHDYSKSTFHWETGFSSPGARKLKALKPPKVHFPTDRISSRGYHDIFGIKPVPSYSTINILDLIDAIGLGYRNSSANASEKRSKDRGSSSQSLHGTSAANPSEKTPASPKIQSNSPAGVNAPKQADSDKTAAAKASIEPIEEEIVYVTKTGTKFHRQGCRFLKKGAKAMSRSQAIAKGLSACLICRP